MADIKGKQWLFKNDNKVEGDNRPVMTGNGEISRDCLAFLNAAFAAGTDVEGDVLKVDCTAWKNVSKAGKSYLFVTFDEKFHKEQGGGAPGGQSSNAPVDDDDEIPF
jgi:hypothetical protein